MSLVRQTGGFSGAGLMELVHKATTFTFSGIPLEGNVPDSGKVANASFIKAIESMKSQLHGEAGSY